MQLTKTTFFLGCLVGGLGSALVPLLFTTLHAEPRLLPFQGRLTDPAGMPIADGAKVVQFQLYDAPTGGNVKWVGEVQKLTINGGLVNTLLGSKASLGSVDFSTATYLQITVDANGDNQITLADPPLLPRQSVVPSVYAMEAGNSAKLAGANWSALMVDSNGTATNDPTTGFLDGPKIRPASITATQLNASSIQTNQLQDSAVTSAKIADGTITSSDLSVQLQQASIIPSGSIMPFAGPVGNIPVGWKLCDGSALKSTDSPNLYAAITVSWGDGTTSPTGAQSSFSPGVTNFNLPDLRGYFLRGLDGAAGRDPDIASRLAIAAGGSSGGAVGSVQSDALQGHKHLSEGNWFITDAYGSISPGGTIGARSTAKVGGPIEDGTNGTPRISSETRPKNAYVNYIIKL